MRGNRVLRHETLDRRFHKALPTHFVSDCDTRYPCVSRRKGLQTRYTGSIPVVASTKGLLAQPGRALARHARGQKFKSSRAHRRNPRKTGGFSIATGAFLDLHRS